jgi:hypothetical protein
MDFHRPWPHLPTVSRPELLAVYMWQPPDYYGVWTPPRKRTSQEPFFPCGKGWLDVHREKSPPEWWTPRDDLTLDDYGLWAVVRRHDRKEQHCTAEPDLLGAEAAMSLNEVETSLDRLRAAGRITGKEVLVSVVMSGSKVLPMGGSKVDDRTTIPLYEWIWVRRELSVEARFILCIGADQAQRAHNCRFTLATRQAAKILDISQSTASRAVAELKHWRLIRPAAFGTSQYFLLEHPWHEYFREHHKPRVRKAKDKFWNGVAAESSANDPDA